MAESQDGGKVSADYTKAMQAKMGSSLSYRHEDGMNYALAFPRIIVGSCLQTPDDVVKLQGENVGIIFCTQEDKDFKHFDLNIGATKSKAAELDIVHVQSPIPDFDPVRLRKAIAGAVRSLARDMSLKPDKVAYIHCTAGLGRAPATALAYMFWIQGMCLDKAYEQLFAVRRCHPQIFMVRASTCDMLVGNEGCLRPWRTCMPARRGGDVVKVVEVAGLDVGWGNRIQLELDADADQFVLNRELPVGTYQYKFIVDGEWMPNLDLPTVDDNGNINNVAEVLPDSSTPDGERRTRIMAKGGMPTPDEFGQIREHLCK